MRTGQALFRQSLNKSEVVVRAQLYVDDPAVVARGKADLVQEAFDILLAWWLALGIPLSWRKGSMHDPSESYEWIGVKFSTTQEAKVIMELPEAFLEQFLVNLAPFCRGHGACKLQEAEKLVGRAGRVAYVVPGARPFVSALYAVPLLSPLGSKQTGSVFWYFGCKL